MHECIETTRRYTEFSVVRRSNFVQWQHGKYSLAHGIKATNNCFCSDVTTIAKEYLPISHNICVCIFWMIRIYDPSMLTLTSAGNKVTALRWLSNEHSKPTQIIIIFFSFYLYAYSNNVKNSFFSRDLYYPCDE